MDIITIKQLAFELMGNKKSHHWKEKGNKYYHGERVAKLALKLRQAVLPNDDSHDPIIIVAAWFHDIMNGVDNHEEEGAKRTREVLGGLCSDIELDKICEIIMVHDRRYSGSDAFSDYIKLHQDADHLDHFGTYDIWTRFLYVSSHDQMISEVMEELQNRQSTEDERLKNELHYDISKKIYVEKSNFVTDFSNRFSVELTGGIWNEKDII